MAGFFDGFQSRATVLVYPDPLTKGVKLIPLDASLSISTNMTASVTQFPIENAGTITDHVQPKPLTVNVSAVFSESPSQKLLTIAQSLASGVADRAGQFQGLSSTFVSAASALAVSAPFRNYSKFDKEAGFLRLLGERKEVDPDYPKRAMLGLQKAFDAGKVFDLRTYFSDVIYKNMVMTSLSFSQTVSLGDSLSFTFTAQKVTTVDSFVRKKSEVEMKDPANSSATEKVNKGKAQTKEEPTGSMLFEGSKAVGGIDTTPQAPTPQGSSTTQILSRML